MATRYNRSTSTLVLTLLLTMLTLSSANENAGFHPTPDVPSQKTKDNNFQVVLDSMSRELYQFLRGNYFQPRYQGSLLLRAYCQNHNSIRLNIVNGYASVYCVKDQNFLRDVMFQSLPKEGLTEDKITGYYAANAVLKAFAYVPVCAIHCEEGSRPALPSGNYIKPMNNVYFSVGCVDAVRSNGEQGDFIHSCKDICADDIYKVDNGKVHCTIGTQVGSVCSVYCSEGYIAMGTESKTCIATKIWDTVEPFKCLPSDVGYAVRNVMKKDGLSVNEAVIELRAMLENYLSEKSQLSPSTRRETISSTEEETAESEIVKLVIRLLAKLSKSTPVTLKHLSACSVASKERRDCGYPGISPHECREEKGCCWDSSMDYTIWCFHKSGDVKPVNYTTKTATKYPNPFHMPVFNKPSIHPTPYVKNAQHTHPDQITEPPVFPATLPNPGVPNAEEEECGCVQLKVARCLGLPQARIFCGINTKAERWPWNAIVYHGDRLCGGTLISKNYVLTAAHCLTLTNEITDYSPSNKVYLGVSSRDLQQSHEKLENIQIRGMKRVIRHPIFYSIGTNRVANDIALIQLADPVTYSTTVRPLCLPGKSRPAMNENCFITGFGKTSASEASPSVPLQSAKVPMMSGEVCSKLYNSFNQRQNICAGSLKVGSEDACKGDSGGPLACQASKGDSCSWYLAGITSFGNEPCGGGSPGVYVNVSHYEDWINSHIYPFQGW